MNKFIFLFLSVAFWTSSGWAQSLPLREVEGLYEVEIVCEDRSNPACLELNRKARLVVLRTESLLTVSVAYPEVSLSRYAFVSEDLQLKDNQYIGHLMMSSSSAAPFAGVILQFFQNEGEKEARVQGKIRDARFSKDLTITGQQFVSFYTFKPGTGDPADGLKEFKCVEGRYLAIGKDRQWILNIRKGLSGSGSAYVAETTDMGSPDGSELASGEKHYLRSISSDLSGGALELEAPLLQSGAYLKWVLWVSQEEVLKNKKLTGFFYSSTGVYSELSLELL